MFGTRRTVDAGEASTTRGSDSHRRAQQAALTRWQCLLALGAAVATAGCTCLTGDALKLQYTAPDGGPPDAADAGGPDAGAVDAGPGDAGPLDAGAGDAGPDDAGALDAGVLDAGAPDAGPADSGIADAGPNPDELPPGLSGVTAGGLEMTGTYTLRSTTGQSTPVGPSPSSTGDAGYILFPGLQGGP